MEQKGIGKTPKTKPGSNTASYQKLKIRNGREGNAEGTKQIKTWPYPKLHKKILNGEEYLDYRSREGRENEKWSTQKRTKEKNGS